MSPIELFHISLRMILHKCKSQGNERARKRGKGETNNHRTHQVTGDLHKKRKGTGEKPATENRTKKSSMRSFMWLKVSAPAQNRNKTKEIGLEQMSQNKKR